MTFLRNLWNDEQGQDLIEYTLLMAFVALASAALFIGAGGSIKGIWTVDEQPARGRQHVGQLVDSRGMPVPLPVVAGMPREQQLGNWQTTPQRVKKPPRLGGALRWSCSSRTTVTDSFRQPAPVDRVGRSRDPDE